MTALGGSLLRPEIDERQTWLADLVNLVKNQVNSGTRLGIVVGGGSPAREGINLAKPLIKDVFSLDEIGISATRLNATIIRELLKYSGVAVSNTIPVNIREAIPLMNEFPVVVMGGTNPGQTTDAVAIELAISSNSSKCIIATNVPKVYEEDPKKNNDARSFDSLTLLELQTIVGPPEHSKAGDSQIVDPIGVGYAVSSGMTLNILDGRNIENIKNAIEDKDFVGTVVSR